jgi:hypothetical protein
MTISFEYDETSAAKADRTGIDAGPHIGRFTSVNAMKSREKQTEGMHFEFESADGSTTGFDLWTQERAWKGSNQVNAMMAILGLRSLRSVVGKYEAFVEGKRQEVEGETFPELCGKDIGLVFQKELYTKQDGETDGTRFNLEGIFHPVTRLTASEIKERKTTPEKLEKMLKNLKVKDSRKPRAAEPAQPPVGADAGSY